MYREKKRTDAYMVDLKYLLDVDYEVPREIIIKGLRQQKHPGVLDIVIRMKITFEEKLFIIGISYIETTEVFTLSPGVYEVVETIKTLRNSLPTSLTFGITIDDITTRTNLTIKTTVNEQKEFEEKSFFHTLLGFMGSLHGKRSFKRR